MTTVVIIEDEPPARERLTASLRQLDPQLEIIAELGSVADAVAWFEAHQHHGAPDLVFADVQLSDGLSLEIFARVQPVAPIVFCTAYDEYMVEALAQNGIAYLLKPYTVAELGEVLRKYRRLETHFSTRLAALARALGQPCKSARRLLARDRDAFVAVPIDEVAYFGVRDGVTELVRRDGRRLELDRTLADIEAELVSVGFFRINRQYLAHADAVVGFRPYFKGRLVVQMQPAAGEDVDVSQPNAARFRSWLEGG
ncbi:LytR/AlgR family response regulator transcription factor [Enhygromyxa salina]|uniref:Sensory transduction protein LytR n=1 Tax=Enhygromyxa salina TaxID=215803 RepID=A0A2S9XFQ2_9BACT|nr:LytTR family DNA-binding domain-containing protein [Enhygromyxa salina]PRP91693.1 Sensory transduction protein LytR [Enhygromyxa salina]